MNKKNDTNSMIDISVIIPHYNSFDTLMRLLNTIPENPQVEVIVVDDYSENRQEFFNVMDAYKNRKNITFYSNDSGKKNAGAARNVGLKKALGKWIIFADADDYFIENAFNVLINHIHSESDIIYFNMTSVDVETGNVSYRHDKNTNILQYYLKKRNHFSELFLKTEWCGPVGRLIRHELIKDNNCKFSEIVAANDIMFSEMVAVAAQTIEAHEDVIYCVVKSKNSLTQNKSQEIMDIRLQEELNICNYLRRNLPEADYKKLNICGIYNFILGLKTFGIDYAKKVAKEYKKNAIPIFKFGIIKNYWIEYHNRII